MILAQSIVDCGVTADTQALLDQIPNIETQIAEKFIYMSTHSVDYWTKVKNDQTLLVDELQIDFTAKSKAWDGLDENENMDDIFKTEP